MPDTGPTSERLEALQERWQAEPDSRVFLQLADEYRRLGRTEEAARVLEEGLSANPHHLAAQVALGRCRLDLGAADEAARLLEGVVESDPTQMVASRLLVEAYLRQGRAEDARRRLRIYSLLNDSDPEIAELRRRIGELDRRHGEAPAGAPDAGAAVEPGGEPESGTGLEGLGEEPFAEPAEPAAAPHEEAPASAASNGEPFPDLAEPSSRRRYLEALASGALFEMGEETAEGAPAAGEPPSDEVFELGAPAGGPVPDLSSLLEPATEPGARPTVTLGRLYLRQGHIREAEEIFREVLARDPGNDEARRHLEELEQPQEAAAPLPPEPPAEPLFSEPAEEPAPPRPALEARDLLAGHDGGEGLTGRKRYVLERYLERLRGRARRDVH